MPDGSDLKSRSFGYLTIFLFLLGLFMLALGFGTYYFSGRDQAEVRIISAENYSEHEIDGVALGARDGELVDVNSAKREALEELPGVGVITAEKIIAGRPYSSVDELLIKKAVGRATFEKIRNLVVAGE